MLFFCLIEGCLWLPVNLIYNYNTFYLCASHVQVQARGALQYLVSLLASMEHSAHHTLLLEIRCLTDRYTSILGGGGKDIYRMSNSFTAIARLLGRKLEADTTLSRYTHTQTPTHIFPVLSLALIS